MLFKVTSFCLKSAKWFMKLIQIQLLVIYYYVLKYLSYTSTYIIYLYHWHNKKRSEVWCLIILMNTEQNYRYDENY